jgi:hypothetical protein
MILLKNPVKVFILILLSSTIINSQNVSKTGTTSASFLEISVGASAIGMGGAFVSLANDASSLYWNPGGAANLGKYEALISHSEWIAETNFDFAALVIPLADFGTLGLSFTSLNMDDMKVRTVELPEGTGEFFSANDIAVGLTYARNLTDRFSIGFTGKFIQQKIWHMSAIAFALDIGTIFKTDLLGGMNIGASILNFGTPLKLEGRDTRYFIRVDETKEGSNERIPTNIEMDSWDLPLIFQIGVSTNAINTDDYRLTLAVDAIHPTNDYESANVGGEFSFMNFIILRAGYQALFLQDAEGGLSLGVGVNSKMLFSEALVKFDYAFRDFGRLKSIHVFTVGMQF